jgi:hypothetical protein
MTTRSAPPATTGDAHGTAGTPVRHGTGAAARGAASRQADALWRAGTAARAMFRPDLGGWVVLVFGPLRRREPAPLSPHPDGHAGPGGGRCG